MKKKKPPSNNLDNGQTAAVLGCSPSRREKRKILKDRAKTLGREPEGEKTAVGYLEAVEFVMAHEKYGIESAYIREIYPLKEITQLPCTPPFVLGIINVRGQILSTIDLKVFFDLPQNELTDLNRVIVLHTHEVEFGILADGILGLRSIPIEDIQPALPTLTGIRAEYLRGVTGEGLVILDAARILSDKRIIVHEEVESRSK